MECVCLFALQNTLSVPQVSREDLGATLSCQATNNNVSAPATSKVTIDLKCELLAFVVHVHEQLLPKKLC